MWIRVWGRHSSGICFKSAYCQVGIIINPNSKTRMVKLWENRSHHVDYPSPSIFCGDSTHLTLLAPPSLQRPTNPGTFLLLTVNKFCSMKIIFKFTANLRYLNDNRVLSIWQGRILTGFMYVENHVRDILIRRYLRKSESIPTGEGTLSVYCTEQIV